MKNGKYICFQMSDGFVLRKNRFLFRSPSPTRGPGKVHQSIVLPEFGKREKSEKSENFEKLYFACKINGLAEIRRNQRLRPLRASVNFARSRNSTFLDWPPVAYQVALHFRHYHFVRIHKTLRVTPAMEAGV